MNLRTLPSKLASWQWSILLVNSKSESDRQLPLLDVHGEFGIFRNCTRVAALSLLKAEEVHGRPALSAPAPDSACLSASPTAADRHPRARETAGSRQENVVMQSDVRSTHAAIDRPRPGALVHQARRQGAHRRQDHGARHDLARPGRFQARTSNSTGSSTLPTLWWSMATRPAVNLWVKGEPATSFRDRRRRSDPLSLPGDLPAGSARAAADRTAGEVRRYSGAPHGADALH